MIDKQLECSRDQGFAAFNLMVCSNFRLFLLISLCLFPFFCSASRSQQQQGNPIGPPSKRSKKGALSFQDQLKLCFVNEDTVFSKQLFSRARHLPTRALPSLRNLEHLEQLLESFPDISGADLDQQDHVTGRTALMNCCVHGSYLTALKLVELGVGLSRRDSHGNTALMLLTASGLPWQTNAEGIKLFRELIAKSDLTLRNSIGQCLLDVYTLSPAELQLTLTAALNRNGLYLVDRLLVHSHNISYEFVPLIQSLPMAQVVFKHGGDKVLPFVSSFHPITGFTILHAAVMKKDYKFVKYLVRTYQCPIDAKERSRGYTPVSLALYLLPKVNGQALQDALNNIVYYFFELAGDQISQLYIDDPIEELIEEARGALWEGTRDLYERLATWEIWTITRMKQVFAKHPNLKLELMKLGFDARFSNGLSPGHMNTVLKKALACDAVNSIGFLLHYDAPTDEIINLITTPTQVSLVIKQIGRDAYQELLNERDENGFTKFHHAVINGDYTQTKRYLTILHADPNLQDDLGRTCLMIALNCTRARPPNTYDMIIRLLAPYSDTSVPDAIGRSPMDMVEKRVIYKKLLKTTVFAVSAQDHKRPLVARDLAYYQTLEHQ